MADATHTIKSVRTVYELTRDQLRAVLAAHFGADPEAVKVKFLAHSQTAATFAGMAGVRGVEVTVEVNSEAKKGPG